MVSAPVSEPAFASITKNKPCFFIWRIENFQVVSVPAEQHGKFFKGDSYIVYSATKQEKTSKAELKAGAAIGNVEVHIHFWIGSETTQDEAAVAAIKTVQLDHHLGGGPVEHRETEGNESNRFRSYFTSGLRYLNGGISTGLQRSLSGFTPSCYHVKGKRRVVVTQMKEISWSEMNEGDVYVLDTNKYIFVWTGRYSNNYEKITAAKFATTLKGEHGCGQVVILEDGNEMALSHDEGEVFEQLLPLNTKDVQPKEEAEPDETVIRRLTSDIKLFKCSDESGTLKVVEVKTGPLFQKDLDSNDSFILDNGAHGVWVWVGKHATSGEREEALRNAQGFITKKGYRADTKVSRVIDGGEPSDFKTLFQDWRDKDETAGYKKRWQVSRTTQTIQTSFDASSLHHSPGIAAQTQMVDDGKGQKEVWRIKKFDMVEVNERSQGEFFTGDCYVILYAYTAASQQYIIYYWIGSEASIDEAGTAALKVVELDDKLQGRATQIRVTQGKEPKHFMALFGGKMIIYQGGFSSSFDGSRAKDVEKKSTDYMLQVRGTSSMNTKAIEVDFRAGCLNSNDCFIVVTATQAWVWCGKGSTGDEREMAKQLTGFRREVVLVSEGRERKDFWDALGGKADYASTPKLQEEGSSSLPARLFQCSNASGILRAEEILNFEQSDLISDDVMILDAWENILVWIGKNANKVEKYGAENLAFEYLRTDPAGRSQGTPVVRIKQGYEPPNFTGFFGAWNNNLWNDDETYADICDRLEKAAPGATVLVNKQPNGTVNGMTNGGLRKSYPMSTLVGKVGDELPYGVDPTRKEDYLCDADFVILLGVDREKFEKLPQWKMLNLKKKADIF